MVLTFYLVCEVLESAFSVMSCLQPYLIPFSFFFSSDFSTLETFRSAGDKYLQQNHEAYISLTSWLTNYSW